MPPSDADRAFFAYSALLDPQTFSTWAARHPGLTLPPGQVAEGLDVDLVYNFHSPRWGGRIGALQRAPGKTVYGLLVRVPPETWPLLQKAEGVTSRNFVEVPVRVRTDGRIVEAVTFTTSPDRISSSGPVSEEYADALARGAQAAGLPSEYVQRLQAEAMILRKVQAAGKQLGLS